MVINQMLDDFEGHSSTSKYAKLAKPSNDTTLRDIRELLVRGSIANNAGARKAP